MTAANAKKAHVRAEHYLKQLEEAKKRELFVGLPKEKVGGKIYGPGMTIIIIGAIHEYGEGDNPMRSFLRVPLVMHRDSLDAQMAKEFRAVAEGRRDANVALGRMGTVATNLVKGAFDTQGYGTWPDITPQQKKRKGSSRVLIDTATLKNSNTWVVR